jgi:hypothetical protein
MRVQRSIGPIDVVDDKDLLDSVIELLHRKREIFGGNARPTTDDALMKYWNLLLDAYHYGGGTAPQAAIRLMEEELSLRDSLPGKQGDEATVEMFEALLVLDAL